MAKDSFVPLRRFDLFTSLKERLPEFDAASRDFRIVTVNATGIFKSWQMVFVLYSFRNDWTKLAASGLG